MRMTKAILSFVIVANAVIGATAQDTPRNIWAEQYKQRSAAEMAAQFEEPSRPVFRYRAAIGTPSRSNGTASTLRKLCSFSASGK